MSESVRVRLVLARMDGDTEPVVVGAIDRTIWEHWDDEDETAWLNRVYETWGLSPKECEWREVWATFDAAKLAASFDSPFVVGTVDP